MECKRRAEDQQLTEGVCSGSPGASRSRKLLEWVGCLGGLQEEQLGVYLSGPQATMFSLRACRGSIDAGAGKRPSP